MIGICFELKPCKSHGAKHFSKCKILPFVKPEHPKRRTLSAKYSSSGNNSPLSRFSTNCLETANSESPENYLLSGRDL